MQFTLPFLPLTTTDDPNTVTLSKIILLVILTISGSHMNYP